MKPFFIRLYCIVYLEGFVFYCIFGWGGFEYLDLEWMRDSDDRVLRNLDFFDLISDFFVFI